MPRVLVVEDEERVRASLANGLQMAGFEVETAATGNQGSHLASSRLFDCIILDWMLPGRDGLEVLADLRQSGRSTPVLLLTARDAIDDRVLGLESGADDYLVKPFAFAELLARVRALLRRSSVEREMVLRAGDLELDLLNRKARRKLEAHPTFEGGGIEIELKPREFEVLEYLMRHKNEPVTREMLGRDVWKDPNYALTNVIEVYVNLLRKKVELPGRTPRIVTLRGVGYSLRE